jgi:hypothetical protein
MVRLGGSKVKIVSGTLQAECAGLFAEWQAAGNARSY